MLSSFATGTPEPDIRRYKALPEFLEQVWLGDIAMIKEWLEVEKAHPGRVLKEVDPVTGMNALHLAVGGNSLEITKLLIEAGIEIIPDNQGRMPSLIAAICRVSDELADYIYEAESRVLKDDEPEGV